MTEVADSWRIAGDIVPKFDSVLYEIDSTKPFYKYQNPGHINDLDMLDLGNGMNEDEDQSHFAMWCMMSTPLMIGCDLTKIKPETLEILKNKELIDLNQDEACIPAYVIKKNISEDGDILDEIWVKDLGKLGSNEKAIAFLNRSNEPINLKLKLEEVGLLGEIKEIRDLIEHINLETEKDIEVELRPHQTKVFKIKAEKGETPENIDKQNDFIPIEYETVNISELPEHLKEEAILIDVRMPDEYEKGHIDGSINIPYVNFHWIIEPMKLYIDREIILTCSTGKRAEQVYQILKYYGFKNVKVLNRD